jgi:GNAT superfamily N-acetyltransferase
VSNGVSIRRWQPTDDVEAITELLHRAYGELAALGLRYLATHQSADVTLERLSHGSSWVAVVANTLVGVISLYATNEDCAYYRKPGVMHFGQFGVDPTFQRQGIGLQLLVTVEREAIGQGALEVALDTAIPATHLIGLYQRLGYEIVDEVQWELANYRSVIMSASVDRLRLEARHQ